MSDDGLHRLVEWVSGTIIVIGLLALLAFCTAGCIRQNVDVRVAVDSAVADSSTAIEGVKISIDDTTKIKIKDR